MTTKLAHLDEQLGSGPQSGVRRIDVSQGLRLDPEACAKLPRTSLEAIAASTLTHARNVMPRAITLTFAKVGQIPEIRGDASELGGVVLALLKNACRAIDRYGSVLVRLAYPDDDPPPRVQGPQVDYVRLDVIDTGRGMPPGTYARVIETLRTGRRNSASGTGLPFVHAIVRRHGGDASVERKERGTRVSLYVPIASPAA